MSSLETADFFFFFLDFFLGGDFVSSAWRFEESDAQLHSRGSQFQEKMKEMNTAICVDAVADSSTLFLPVVTRKAWTLEVLPRCSNVGTVPLQLDNQQEN